MTLGYLRAESDAVLTMSWLARLQRGKQAEKSRERARLHLWEFEGGSLCALSHRPPRSGALA